MKNFRFKLAFRFFFSAMIEHFLYFLKLILLGFLTWYIWIVPPFWPKHVSFFFRIAFVGATSPIFFIMLELFNYNAASAGLNILKNEPIKKAYFSKLFKRNFWKFLVSRLWYFIKVTLGLILFIIPGIHIAIKDYFTGFDIIDKSASIEKDIRTTKKLTVNAKFKLFSLATLLTIITTFLTPFLMIIYPLINVHIYKQLIKKKINNN